MELHNLPPDLLAKLARVMGQVDEREPEGEVSFERVHELNEKVFEIRKRLLNSHYKGAKTATDNLIDSIKKESNSSTREQTLKMAIVSLEATIDESKKDLMQSLLKQKFESRKVVKRGFKYDEDMDMLDVIIAASEEEADYNPAEIQQREEQATKPKETSGFGFGQNRA